MGAASQYTICAYTDNPGNGDNTNYGAHCVQTWLPEASSFYDVISFQFGLHDIAYDEERLSVSQYKMLLANITHHLVSLQQAHGTKLVWVKTTPVPTVASAYGFGCDGAATVCLNPARFDADVVKYNAAAAEVMSTAIAQQVRTFIVPLGQYVITGKLFARETRCQVLCIALDNVDQMPIVFLRVRIYRRQISTALWPRNAEDRATRIAMAFSFPTMSTSHQKAGAS